MKPLSSELDTPSAGKGMMSVISHVLLIWNTSGFSPKAYLSNESHFALPAFSSKKSHFALPGFLLKAC